MRFTKMHGIGNDYIYVNGFEEKIDDPHELAVRVSDVHFGIGSDGLIIINPSDEADFTMDMFNADGSRGTMCGNGIRCVGKYVFEHGMTDKTHLTISTKAGIKTLDLLTDGKQVKEITVDMGAPAFAPQQIPAVSESEMISAPLEVGDATWAITAVSMGNPHCVVPVDDPYALDIEKIGPRFEHHPLFPDRVNTEFIKVQDRKNILMRVWERGSGETWACGTGACAVAAACIRNGWTDETVTVHLRGGDLKICWDRKKDTILMTGPAATVCEGDYKE